MQNTEKQKKDMWMLTCIVVVLLAALFYLTVPVLVHADPVIQTDAGANVQWYDDEAYPSDFELGGNGSASLSPHIAAVGCAYWGFGHSYARGSVGARFTITDAENPNFSAGLGASYHVSSEASVRPQEFCAEAAIGWRPWPQQAPRITLVSLGTYGLDSNRASVLVGARYSLRLP